MRLLAAALIASSMIASSATATNAPPARTGQCVWVHGRFSVYNGSSVRRIWLIGTHRVVALHDDDTDLPPVMDDYQASPDAKDNKLYGDFEICAREPSRLGHMQHVSLKAAKHLIRNGKPWLGE